MSKTVLIILSTVLVLGLTLLVTNILSRRKKTDLADWEVGGRDLPYYVVIGTQFATAMGGGVLVGHVGNAYNFGLSILFYGLFSSSTLLFIALIAKWLRRNNFVTVPDVVQSFRGRNKAISIFAGVMSAVIPFGWCISNLSAFAKLYTRMTGIPMNVLITCLAIACIAFVLPAGLKTVAWTDFIFGIVIVIGGVFVTMKSLDMAGGFSNVVEVLPPEIMSFPKGLFAVGGFTLLSWFLSLVPGGITNQMYFQRVFAIRDEKRIVPTLLISVVLVFLTDVWAFFMGTSIRAQNPDLAGEMATGWLLDQLPIWFIVIFAGMITCTILSTISSGIQSTVVNITRDCYGALNPEAAKDGAKMMRVSRTLTVILIAFAAISAMFIPSVLNTLVYTYSYSAASMLCRSTALISSARRISAPIRASLPPWSAAPSCASSARSSARPFRSLPTVWSPRSSASSLSAISPALRSRQTNSLRKQLLTNHRFFHLSHGRGERQLGTASPPCSFKSPDFTTFNA